MHQTGNLFNKVAWTEEPYMDGAKDMGQEMLRKRDRKLEIQKDFAGMIPFG